jgi:hypothetical protein
VDRGGDRREVHGVCVGLQVWLHLVGLDPKSCMSSLAPGQPPSSPTHSPHGIKKRHALVCILNGGGWLHGRQEDARKRRT